MGILIKNIEELSNLKNNLKGRLVCTNGCFDILHVGHVRYLQSAKELGDYLLIGVNSDSSVKKLKGTNRPINSQENRAEILNALNCVDYTFIFNEITANNFLKHAKPDIYVKGGDYNLEELPEKPIIEELNCKVIFLNFHKGFSTSKIIEKINN